MKTVYVQQLLKVLIEEYEDIDYMLERAVAERPSRTDSAQIRRLLKKLDTRNHALLSRLQS